MSLIECVPNVSAGRDPRVVGLLADACRDAGAAVLDVHSDPDHNRSVLTLAGSGPAVAAAAVALARVCLERVDVRGQVGVHPKMGALDVCPFVPLDTATADALGAAREAAAGIAGLGIPVFFYDLLAPGRRTLPALRREAFVTTPPDLGPRLPHPRAGAVALGVRGLLVAFNIDLDTDSPAVAKEVATEVRESGGGLAGLRALGLHLPGQRRVQVSMNVTRPDLTPLGTVWRAVAKAAAARGVGIRRGELVGLAPAAALEHTSGEALARSRIHRENTIEDALARAGLRSPDAPPLDVTWPHGSGAGGPALGGVSGGAEVPP